MKWPHALLILLVIVLCLMGQPRIAAIPASPLTLEVNPADPQASDAVTPFRTIAAALAWAQAHDRPTDIYIHGGIYREALGTIHHRQMPLRLVAQAGERVIVRGSQQWSDWQEVSSTPRFTIYRHPWTLAWGFSGNPWTNYGIELPLVAQRGELVWWRDTPLRQRLSFRELQGDDFYVDDTEQQLYVALSVGISPSELEVAVHREALRILDSGFISLVGLRFEHYGGTFSQAVRIERSHDIEVKDCTFWGNNWGGLESHQSDRLRVERTQFLQNGWRGMAGVHLRDFTVQQVLVQGNNWRGAWAGFYDWDAGDKYFHLRRAVFDRYRAIENQAAGLWLDTDNQNVEIRRSQFLGNAVVGLFLEASTGPVTIEDSLIAYNYSIAPNYLQTPGIFGWAVAHVTLRHNWIWENQGAQIGVRDPSPRTVTLPETGEEVTMTSQDWYLEGNWIGSRQEQLLTTLKGEPFLQTLKLQDNHWWSEAAYPFRLEGENLTWSQWQEQYGNASDRWLIP
ncbi:MULTISPECIES: right-handed parallel beta-helix repeat-containing protein [unclassified Thermosynechococcus]|uniref:right-handed parallel beta-helix repeat-containing protein n=2 Tax=unclassified Thermosynechococcus TaxID=2622553 RepID=UPI0019805F51|nr:MULTISPECIES: right-handed parallel beta-helix repeat-containing protein [unclassified Thermosynechococcus]QSF50094.1 right-handed parallel beta-helix repeat-containing protein [Thermosynechococcus sp. TA-1]WNC23206.1 right-handed parallel beta-helix repeat-containing protein [Thermosynechococcus sp. PP22]WNC33444.1 right-handed parallel beta-helix repeat-containing protein [Thermosynechococcus sp. PKX95]WNC35968.1 right-handed parallel beta-helix repeat-containing protein [Thermosynechococc